MWWTYQDASLTFIPQFAGICNSAILCVSLQQTWWRSDVCHVSTPNFVLLWVVNKKHETRKGFFPSEFVLSKKQIWANYMLTFAMRFIEFDTWCLSKHFFRGFSLLQLFWLRNTYMLTTCWHLAGGQPSSYQSNFQFRYRADNLWSKSRNLGINQNETRLNNHSIR